MLGSNSIESNNLTLKSSSPEIEEEVLKFNSVLSLEALRGLSEAEIKFLSLSKEKQSSSEIVEKILTQELTLRNFEEMFCLTKYTIANGTVNPEQAVRNIRYKDEKGVIVATIQVDTINKKIRMQNLGNILPKQECFTPYQVGTKLQNLAKYKKWNIEDGGVNQFNGNTEIRYKDSKGNVMAAVITKNDGTFDTIAEYSYSHGYRTKMLLTNQYGQSLVVYDGTKAVNQLTRIDIDNGGMIIEITKVFSL